MTFKLATHKFLTNVNQFSRSYVRWCLLNVNSSTILCHHHNNAIFNFYDIIHAEFQDVCVSYRATIYFYPNLFFSSTFISFMNWGFKVSNVVNLLIFSTLIFTLYFLGSFLLKLLNLHLQNYLNSCTMSC